MFQVFDRCIILNCEISGVRVATILVDRSSIFELLDTGCINLDTKLLYTKQKLHLQTHSILHRNIANGVLRFNISLYKAIGSI